MLKIKNKGKELAQAPLEIRSGKYTQVNLSMEDVNFFEPYQLVQWKCIIDLAVEYNLEVSIEPPQNQDVGNYAGRMGLFEGSNYKYPYNCNISSTFFPLIKVKDDKNVRIYEDSRRVFKCAGATNNYIDDVSDHFTELADNIYFHSGQTENSGWGYIHAQTYKSKICLGICDIGVGVYGSYKRTNQIRGRSEAEVIKDIFQELESSLNTDHKPRHRGIGLSGVKSFIDSQGGYLDLYTGKTKVTVKDSEVSLKEISHTTYGTLIIMKVPIL